MTALSPSSKVSGTGTGAATGTGQHWSPGEEGDGSGNGGTAVALRDLSCVFGTVRALDGMSIDIAPGEFLALLGPSGCGKTTALRILAGFENATSGRVLVDGRDIQDVPAQKRNMGMVFQSYSLFPNMTVLENVAFGLRLRKIPTGQRRAKAMSLLEMVELDDRAGRYPHQLSGGQQQRVALARALAIEPSVLLLDEPLSALDAKVRVQLREQIRALQRRLSITTVFVTHDQEEALSISDRVAVMRNGRLEQVASPAELYDQPQTPFVAEFVGTMNRLPGRLTGQGRVEVLGRQIAARGPVASGRPAGSEVDVLCRPEALALARVDGANGIVTALTFRGAQSRVEVLLWADVSAKVDVASSVASSLDLGSSVEVSLTCESALVDNRASGAASQSEEA
ncbi:MAG TPA: ABC transporter ATP-binding protein [Acidimicrobiales bacterium]|nr:ABC transporter ATP-binding protein [Acidimicrobiales bacterium]